MSDASDNAQQHGEIPPWRCPKPAELPELRGKMATWLAERGAGFYLESLLVGSQEIRPPGPLQVSAAQLAAEECRRVVDGDLFWVSAEMTDLAQHAGQQLTKHEIYEHDMPCRSGFMVFEKPISDSCVDGIRLEIVAVSWGIVHPPLLLREEEAEVVVGSHWPRQAAVWFTFYSDPKRFIETNRSALKNAGRERTRDAGPFMPDNELIWALDQLEELPAGEDVTSAWGKTVVAAWLLMQQPLAAQETERALRPARRRLSKAGLPTSEVRLVRVRRPDHRPASPGSGQSGRAYSVRWWVDGHWRRYHCGPGGERIERRWISPYLAGPDDKPVHGTERVKIWDR